MLLRRRPGSSTAFDHRDFHRSLAGPASRCRALAHVQPDGRDGQDYDKSLSTRAAVCSRVRSRPIHCAGSGGDRSRQAASHALRGVDGNPEGTRRPSRVGGIGTYISFGGKVRTMWLRSNQYPIVFTGARGKRPCDRRKAPSSARTQRGGRIERHRKASNQHDAIDIRPGQHSDVEDSSQDRAGRPNAMDDSARATAKALLGRDERRGGTLVLRNIISDAGA